MRSTAERLRAKFLRNAEKFGRELESAGEWHEAADFGERDRRFRRS
jgi:hypothetical protein